MYTDIEQARDEALTAIMQMTNALRTNAETVEHRYLERLMVDRDEMLAYAHFSLSMPIMDMAAKTGIEWTDLYDIVDAVKDRKLAEHRAAHHHLPWPFSADVRDEPATAGDALDGEVEP